MGHSSYYLKGYKKLNRRGFFIESFPFSKNEKRMKSYKYKLKPTIKQQHILNKTFGGCRFIYNWSLSRKIEEYKNTGTSLSYKQLAHEVSMLRNDSQFPWLKEISSTALQCSVRNLVNSYERFFKTKKGFPKYKSKYKSKCAACYTSNYKFDFINWKVKIPMCGWVRICKSRDFDTCIKTGTLKVTKDKCGTYWCSINVYEDSIIEEKPIEERTTVGIDLGLKSYAVLSNGTVYRNPRFYEKGQKKLATLQRKLAKTIIGSKRHSILSRKIAIYLRKITNRRNNFLHNLSAQLVDKYDTICLEDLDVAELLTNNNSKMSKSIQSASWSEFRRQLQYKAKNCGKHVIVINRFAPSSKKCSVCGYVNNNIILSDRQWKCPKCDTILDRDLNAAINIKNYALNIQSHR